MKGLYDLLFSWHLKSSYLFQLARSLGLPTVEFDVIPVTDVDSRMAQVLVKYLSI